MRKFLSLLAIISLIISLGIYVPSAVKSDGYGDNLPPISGDWIITQDTYVGNETITLNGNLTIEPGATLIFRNVTLIMNSTVIGIDAFHIEVKSGATFLIGDLDDNNITRYDASNITAASSAFPYFFWVRDGANFSMRNSELHRCGAVTTVPQYAGLYIQTDNATINYTLISRCHYGVILYGSDAVVSNNTIEWCDTGVLSMIWSNATIENNLIRSNWVCGIRVFGGSSGDPKPANPLIRNNTILDTGRGTNTADGVNVEVYSRPIIENNVILRSTEDGMYFMEQSSALIKNNHIDDAKYGIATSSVGYLEVINTTISNTSQWDVSVSGGCVNLINVSFNKTKVVFQDSFSYTNLTVNWFLNTYVKDSYGNPIEGATARVRDNANGTSDENFTTVANGEAKWMVLTEKVQTKSGNVSFTPHNITITKSGYSDGFAEPDMNASKTVIITLTDIENPIADAGTDQTVNEDNIVYLDGSGSTDNAEIVNYTWSFYDGSPLVNLFGVNASYIFTQPGTYSITLNVSDASGNWGTDLCVIYVNDRTAPVADAGTDQSVAEDVVVHFDGTSSFDNVGIVWYNWTFGDGIYQNGANATPNHIYTNAGTYIVTLNVTDTIGQWDEDTALVFVDNVGPGADAGSDIVADEGQPILFDASDSTDTNSDQTNLLYTWYFGDGETDTGIVVNHTYEDDEIYTATLIVTDDNGFVDTDTIIVTVNNVAPTIEPVSARTILEDSLFTHQINATDVPVDILTFSDNTTLFDINPITGMIEFTPTNDGVGDHSVNITVVDGDGGRNYTILTITVVNMNDSPVIDLISQQTAVEDVEFTLQIVAEDVDVGDVLTYSMTTYPARMIIDDTGLITWTPINDDVGSHIVIVKAEDDGGLFDTQSFSIVVSNMNDAPTIITNSLADATEDVFYFGFVHAEDIDAGDTLIYSLEISPTFLSIDSVNGMIFGTPGNDDVGTHNVIVNVTDGDDYVTKTFDLSVVNVNDVPIIASSPILTADIGVEYSYDVFASDVDSGDVLTYSLAEGPDSMTINGSKIAWTPTTEQQGKTFQVVVEVSDSEITTTQSFVVSVGEIPEGTNVWPTLLMGLVGGLVGAVVITWLLKQRKKEDEIQE